MPQDYYEILEINRDATQAAVKQAVQDQLNDVKAALIILSDQEKRQAYDELLEKMNSPQSVPIQSKEPNKTTFRLLEAFTAIIILAMIAGGYWFVTGYTVPNSSVVTNEISVPPPTSAPKTTENSVIMSELAENEIIPPATIESSKSVINQAIVEEVVTPIKTSEQNVPLVVENVENQIDITEKQAEVIVKSPVTPVEQEESVVTEEPTVTEKTVITDTVTPVETITPVNETATTELPAKILYKDFFQQNKTIAITIALTNNLDKSIQSFDGIVTLYEQDNSVIGAVSLSEYDILKQINKPNKYAIQKDKTQRWGLNINAAQNATIYTQIVNKRLTALKIKFFLTEVTYIDGEKVSF